MAILERFDIETEEGRNRLDSGQLLARHQHVMVRGKTLHEAVTVLHVDQTAIQTIGARKLSVSLEFTLGTVILSKLG